MEYAVVDIETTGGHAAGGSITEIAIHIFDGEQITDSYETLVKPKTRIPAYISLLTGIDEAMVTDCPEFTDIAGKVFELLQGRIFVAHNVNFDYSFLQHHLQEAGYAFAAPKLCTIRMARKIKPGLRSYSLGRLCEVLEIPLEQRHRAGGDAAATVLLFSKLMEWDTNGVVTGMLKQGTGEQQLPPNLPGNEYHQLPQTPGVYYFHDQKGKVIYVGKAKNIKKRVAQHFGGNSPARRRQDFMRDIFHISHERCGTELMAYILECIEIKRLWPKYNRALKNYEPKFGLFAYEDLQGYKRLAIGKYSRNVCPIQVFTTREGGINKLYHLIRRFDLCPSLCRLGNCERCSLLNQRKDLLCSASVAAEQYNRRVDQALSYLKTEADEFYIVDRGRTRAEKSCILVTGGRFYGMGYIDNADDIKHPEDIKDRLTAYEGNHYIMQLIISFMCKYPNKIRRLPKSAHPVSAS